MPISKPFSVAKEGTTTDGRKIQREWLEAAAKNYNPKRFGARVNLEHLRSVYPDSYFKMYGDVTELSTEERDGELHLMAVVDATDDLVALHTARQKIYASIELDLDFADSGEPYLVGLAMTDSPASLGTEIMTFASTAAQNPFAARKQRPENILCAASEALLDFTPATEATEKASILGKIKSLFVAQKTDTDQYRAELEKTLELLAEKISEFSALKAECDDLKATHETLKAQLSELKEKLENEPATTFTRAPATGGASVKTDC